MSEYFPEPKSSGGRVESELDLFNYTAKADIDKLDIDKLKNVPTNKKNLESKVGKLNADQLVPVPVGLSQLIDLVKNDVF